MEKNNFSTKLQSNCQHKYFFIHILFKNTLSKKIYKLKITKKEWQDDK